MTKVEQLRCHSGTPHIHRKLADNDRWFRWFDCVDQAGCIHVQSIASILQDGDNSEVSSERFVLWSRHRLTGGTVHASMADDFRTSRSTADVAGV